MHCRTTTLERALHPKAAIDFRFLPGHMNLADILSKHWGYQQVWTSTLRPLLFWMGDTKILLEEELGTARNTSDDETQSTAEHTDNSHANTWPEEGERQISEEIEVHPAHSGVVMESMRTSSRDR